MNEKYFEDKCRIAIALSDFGDFDRESRAIDIVNLLKRIAKDQRKADGINVSKALAVLLTGLKIGEPFSSKMSDKIFADIMEAVRSTEIEVKP